MQLNLSEWALKHRSFIVYCMIVLMVVGAMSYYRLGRNEDPAFTFRTMVVQAAWPGAGAWSPGFWEALFKGSGSDLRELG